MTKELKNWEITKKRLLKDTKEVKNGEEMVKLMNRITRNWVETIMETVLK